MELILGLLYERRRSSIAWRQIICAAVLALSFAGMYHYVSAHAEYRGENFGERTAPVMPGISVGTGIETGRFIPAPSGTGKEETEPDAASIASRAAEDAGNISNVFTDSEPEVLKPKRNKTGTTAKRTDAAPEKAKKKITRTESRAVENPVLPSVSEGAGVIEKIEESIKLPEPAVTKEISGFICNDKGYITGCTDPSKFLKDSLVVLPRDSACTGIMKGTFDGLEEKISEIFITANITYIEEGTFDSLCNLIFIEVDPRNTEFVSVNGILYSRDGKVVAYPARRM